MPGVPGHLLFSQSVSTFKADADTATERNIKELEFLLVDLIAKGDIETYSTYLTDDYIRIGANGILSTKEQALTGFRRSGAGNRMMPHDLNVRVYDSTAIMRGILDLEAKDGKRRTSIITKVFIRRNGKWYMASLQGTAVVR